MIETPPLVDQYCHGVLRTELGLGTFEAQLIRSAGPPAAGTTFFDTQTGFAVRRWCPPLLGLEPYAAPARYLARRRELGAIESARLLLRGSGIAAYVVDTGVAGDLTGPKEMALAGDAEAFETVRLEPLAQQVADTSGTVAAFLANLAEAVHQAATGAVAFTCGAADHPSVLADAPEPPDPGEVRGAAGRWLAGRTRGDALRDPVLLRHLVWSAVASGLPLQLYTGAGDPAPLTGFVRATAGLGTRLVLLGGYPYHRQTAQLAEAFPHVYADAGAALGQTGARAAAVLAELLELAPFGKLLFSSGGRRLPELHAVGALVFREALGRVLGGWVADGAWSWTDAGRVAAMVAAGNARRVYRLDERE
ncbi:amidohydrolase [Streptomyces sp. ISL-44]|uniref:amidohydrolase family protein n=1 Tax=Streptomyces sp. ISL-44 TaxID=2819184 RepID=UPI001BE78BAF|nr:amidohydrolase family protein [Streptomyces sp. ISL-44]MBT2541254.1 amidohydrolase [Streptomyces sp. ISL-44]